MNMNSMENILVVAAHPDDEILGCGGTIAKSSQENEVFVLILGEGITSRDIPDNNKIEELSKLKNEMFAANNILGTKEVFTEDLPDNKFDTVPLLDIIKIVEGYVQKINPDIVYTHHRGDLNIDHRITFDAVLTACRPIEGNPVKKLLSFEVPSSTEWNIKDASMSFNPNVYEDISGTIDKKTDAMSAYKNEIRVSPHPRSVKKIRSLAETRGAESGMNFAEAFMLIRELRV
jgi:LmbE family N-acetylglucosaminyl deacetylase